MTKKEVNERFNEDILPVVIEQYGIKDRIAKAEAWNNFVDYLNKQGEVTDYQANTWHNPY